MVARIIDGQHGVDKLLHLPPGDTHTLSLAVPGQQQEAAKCAVTDKTGRQDRQTSRHL